MGAFSGFGPGCISLVPFSLMFVVCVWGNRTYFPTKSEIICRMVKDLSCKGVAITRIAKICGHHMQGQGLRHNNETPFHGSPCKRNHNCQFRKSVCFRGICLCKPGFYFSKELNVCLRECDEFDDGMDIYKGIGIKGHNDKMLYNTTLTSCCDFCIKEKTFTCLTVDWTRVNGQCCLSRKGYRDVLIFSRQHNQPKWTLAQRRCK